jgi:RNA polymerase sigma-70 factor (family 1)
MWPFSIRAMVMPGSWEIVFGRSTLFTIFCYFWFIASCMNTSLNNKDWLPEPGLWELLRRDDKEAFTVLYRHHWPEMYKSAFNILKDRDQSMDIVQEIFIWLWEHRHQLLIKTSLKGYLLAAVKFKTANAIRNGKVREDFFKQVAAADLLPRENEAGLRVEVKELEEVIRLTIGALPDKCRTIYQLSRHQHLSNKEIANQLGLSVKTVESQMTIALKRLRVAVARIFFLVILFLPFLRFF